MTASKERVQISTDPKKIQIDFVHGFLKEAYWAKGRTRETVENCIRHSLNFGLYLDGDQIGYARVLSDFGVLAYLMDVFIDPSYRGQGYGKQLLDAVFNHEGLARVENWKLATADAHELYETYGFKVVQHPERQMEYSIRKT